MTEYKVRAKELRSISRVEENGRVENNVFIASAKQYKGNKWPEVARMSFNVLKTTKKGNKCIILHEHKLFI